MLYHANLDVHCVITIKQSVSIAKSSLFLLPAEQRNRLGIYNEFCDELFCAQGKVNHDGIYCFNWASRC